MKRMLPVFAFGFMSVVNSFAAEPSRILEERFKASLNQVVQDVYQAKDPAEKRQVLGAYIGKMEHALGRARDLPSLNETDRKTLETLRDKFVAYGAELNGQGGFRRVSDSNLDRFATYMLQSMEQAPVGGGIYISAGALIIILLLLILLF